MKSVILSFILIAWSIMVFAQPGAISNILVSQGTGESERVVDIMFDLSGNDPYYELTMEVSFDNGGTYTPIDPGEVSGGSIVTPGAGIQLVWDGRVSYAGIASDMARIRITAITYPCGDPITDIDGNVYNTVLIGEQCWMAENLKTTRYRNEIPIENIPDNTDWRNSTTGAYAWYDNDISWKDSFGALYNWYAVNDTNGLCPPGWHVPSDAEWTALSDYVSSQSGYICDSNSEWIGKALAATTVWDTSTNICVPGNNPTANNVTGFSGLPGGFRSFSGGFGSVGKNGVWFSSTEFEDDYALYRSINFSLPKLNPGHHPKYYGFSVRCIKDD
ncbi:MAG: fibrobacter succinogenes major paralogous domain-containing protein [Bacteroidales bacterium]